MGRIKAPNNEIINKIQKVLRKNSQGSWIREIARQSGISKSCVQVYLSRYMCDEVEEALSVSGLVKLYRLKGK